MTPERWREVERVYHAALEREGDERTAFVASACRNDQSLRLHVDALLVQERRAETFLATPALEMAARALADASGTMAEGETVGGYHILSCLGAGGMGEVYRAHDPKLGRDVAIKVLPRLFAADPDRLARFQREARILASLNHPHIGAIYGLELIEGVPALLLELVEGDTLDELIANGPLPVVEALAMARQIADALEAAHDSGIVHRDLKPANIKITAGGAVKVLDFGLARAAETEPGPDPRGSPGVATLGGTRDGALLGTVAYMSPEQARGKAVDKRADIWAFGCVLYEMLTGRQAFAAETLADTFAGIIQREPDWAALPPTTPSEIRKLLRRCLEKDPSRRLRDAGDVRIEIDDVLREPSAGRASPAVATTAGRGSSRWLPLIMTGAVAALVAGAITWIAKPNAAPIRSPLARLTVSLPAEDTLWLLMPSLALSPNGRLLAYTASVRGGTRQLFVRSIDSLGVTALAGTEGAAAPFFSPNGRWIGFFAGGKLKKVLATGGGVQTLCEAAGGLGGSWGADDSIYFAPFSTSGIWRVSAAGGSAQEFTRVDRTRGEVSHRFPQVLPDGRTVLFTVWTGPGWDEKNLEAQLGASGERRLLARGASTGRYLSTGHLVYARNEELVAVPFNLAQLRTTGPPVTLSDRTSEQLGEGAEYTVSDTGTLAYVPSSGPATERRMVWVGANGKVDPLPAPRGAYTDPAISPDGRSIAVSMQGPTQTIWIYDLARSTLTTLSSAGSSQSPTWTPDGRRLVYRGTQGGRRNLFWRAADGSGSEERLTTTDTLQTPATVSRDAATLLFYEMSPETGMDLWMMRFRDRQSQVILRTPYMETSPKLSRDGRWLAYRSNQSGRDEIYVRAFGVPGGTFPISAEGGSEPVWSRDGRQLFYRNGDKMMGVDIGPGSKPTAGAPHVVFEGHYQVSDTAVSGYDVAADGRFLMIEPSASPQPATRINVVLNWFDELTHSAPSDVK